jgi:xylulokinase
MPVSQRLVAGVDSSTQSCKVVVCDADTGEIVRSARAPHPDGTEVHPDRWWEAWLEATGGGILDGVSAVAVAGQQHGMVTLDEFDEVVRPALLWNDTRSAPDAEALLGELGGAAAWAAQVGVVPVAAVTVTKLRWLARCEPETAARVRRCVLPHDWLTGRILGGGLAPREWTTDRGDASGTGYWSAVTGDYRPDILEFAMGRTIAVPRVLGPDEPAGMTADGMLVAAGTGDNMGAALGLGLEHGDAVVSLGTSGTVFACHELPISDPTGVIASFADAAGGFLPLMCTLNAARVLSAAATMLGTDLAGLDQLALAGAPGAGGLTLLPYLDGERTPDLPSATGTLGGLTRANATPENLARAAVEGMLCNLAYGVDALRQEGVAVDRVLLIGGAAASWAVRAIAPQLFGVPVAVPVPGEYVGIGAARQAAWALASQDHAGAPLPQWEVSTETGSGASAGAGFGTAGTVDSGTAEQVRARYAELLAQVHGLG